MSNKTVTLTAKSGRIWPNKPVVSSGGLISVLWHSPKSSLEVTPKLKATCAIFNQRGDALATSDSRGNVYIFRLTKNRYERLQAIGTAVTAMCFSTLRKSELFVASRDGKIRCFDIDSRRLLKTLTGHRHAVTAISFHPFKGLMTTSSVESLSVWDLKKWKKVRTLGAGSGVVTSTFTPDGKLLLIAFRDDSILAWSTDSFENICAFEVPPRLTTLNITTLSVSSNGMLLVAGGKRRQIMVWDLATQSPLRSVELPTSVTQLLSIKFLPKSTVAAVLADDGRVRLMDLNQAVASPDGSGHCPVEHTIARKDKHVLGVEVDANAKFAACCVSDGSLLLYDLDIARAYSERVRQARVTMGSVPEEVMDTLPMVQGEEELSKPPPARVTGRGRRGGGGGGGGLLGRGGRGGEQVNVPGAPQAPMSGMAPAMVDATDEETQGGEKAEGFLQEEKEQQHQRGRGGVDDSDQLDGLQMGDHRHVVKKDAAYWLEQSMPVPTRQMPSSELLHEAFGNGPSSAAAQVLKQQRALQRQRRQQQQQMPSPSSGGIGGRNGTGSLSRPRLAKLLRTYGRFPSKYRLTVWKYLLDLPGNNSACQALMDKGLHPRYSDLERQWPVRDQRVLRHFRKILSCLSHWSGVFADLPYLPYLVFPFVMVYKSDMMGALETTMSVLTHWCGDWFETYPHPPIPQLSAVERILEFHDRELLEDFKARAIDSRQYAWQMMRTLFTQVLTEEEWLVLFDHYFLHSDAPSLIVMTIVTYLHYFRSSLLSSRSSDDVLSFLRRQNPIQMDDFIKLMFELRSRTPDKLFPQPPKEDTTTTITGGSCFPLPHGQYPVFERYPKYVVDFQLQERQRLAAEEESIAVQRTNLQELQEKSKVLSEQNEVWKVQQRQYLEQEEERLSQEQLKSDKLKAERVQLNKLSEERRLRQIALQQSSIEDLRVFEAKALALEQKKREREVARRIDNESQYLEERKKEEEILSLEYATMVKLKETETKRGLEEQLKALRAEFIARDTSAVLASKREEQKMKLEDEYRRKTLEVQTQQATLLARQAELDKLRRAMESKEALATMDRDQKMEVVKRERMLRTAEDHAQQLASDDHQKQIQRERLLLAEEARQERMLLVQHSQWRDDQTLNRKRILDEETRRRFVESELRERRLRDLEQLQRDRDLEEALLARRSDEIKGVMEEENELRSKLSQIEEERQKDRRIEMQLLAREHELHKKASVENVMRSADQRLVQGIRSKKPSIKRTNTFADDGLTSEELASRAEKLLKQSRKNTASK